MSERARAYPAATRQLAAHSRQGRNTCSASRLLTTLLTKALVF